MLLSLCISEDLIYAVPFLFVTKLYVCDVCISRTYGVGVLNVWKEPLGLLGLCPPSCLCAMQKTLASLPHNPQLQARPWFTLGCCQPLRLICDIAVFVCGWMGGRWDGSRLLLCSVYILLLRQLCLCVSLCIYVSVWLYGCQCVNTSMLIITDVFPSVHVVHTRKECTVKKKMFMCESNQKYICHCVWVFVYMCVKER